MDENKSKLYHLVKFFMHSKAAIKCSGSHVKGNEQTDQ